MSGKRLFVEAITWSCQDRVDVEVFVSQLGYDRELRWVRKIIGQPIVDLTSSTSALFAYVRWRVTAGPALYFATRTLHAKVEIITGQSR